ncbi:BTB/POZ and MATH domain-containing protein 1-like [Lolium perenne]|uniref:BTB/POZ and MATH domain-containing protein 1-like n=1 Tax=Lolium perenne TaxID=4522 RepID=UPI0021EA56D3|nr:BTB/POZ and MATH domain-containing protein 1-like [Lolium perenne]
MAASSGVAGDDPISRSASSIVASAVSGSHLLKIVGYSRTKEVPNGKQIRSFPFRVGGRTWHLDYFPNGAMPEDIDFISLYLTLDDTVAKDKAVKAQAKFSLLDQHGKPVPTHNFTTQIRDFAVCKGWGIKRLIKREELEKSEHLKDDSFTVKVDVTILSDFHVQETPSILEPPSISVPPPDMQRHFGDLLSSKVGIDVKFRVGQETFSAHRLVLAARSPVFRAEFFGPMKEGTMREAIQIDDMEAEVFKALLTFMYTDALPDMDQGEECAMAQHLLVAADRYDLGRLKLICQDKLSSGIDTSSVATILALADQHHCHELKAACLKFLSSPANLDVVMESEGFELLTKSCPGVMKDILRSHVAPSLLGKTKSRASA